MSLQTSVTARFSNQFLVNVSNPQNSAQTSIDTTRLGLACTDVEALFATHAGVTYSDSTASHVMAAVPAVIDVLRVYTGQVLWSQVEESIVSRLKSVALVTGRNRITPTTDSLLNPTQDTPGSIPKSDLNNFNGYRTASPSQPTFQE